MQGSQSPYAASTRHTVLTIVFALVAALMPLAPAFASNANGDRAYVDGAAGRAVADPARADGGGPPPATATAMPQPANLAAEMQLAQQMAAQQAQQPQGPPGIGPGQQPPAATPAQQIGAGLTQDAASLLDAGVQRQIYGPQGPVYYVYPGAAPLSDDLAPPAPSGP